MVVTAVSGTDVTFTWTEPDDNEEPLIGYVLKIRKSDGTYRHHSMRRNRSLSDSCLHCLYGHSQSLSLLADLKLVQAIVSAENSLGS